MEIWDVYNRQGKVTGKVKTRDDVFSNDEYHLGTSLWIVNERGEMLIQKRSLLKRINPGKWSITGGSAKAGESSEQACLREVSEEIGLRLDIKDIKLLSRSYGDSIIFDDYIIFRDFSITDAVLQADEVSEIKWASANEIKELFFQGQFMFDDIAELIKVFDYINVNGSLNEFYSQ